MPLPEKDDADYARMASIQKDAAGNILTASLKADENCFRQRQTDALSRLYDAVEAAERATAAIDVTPAVH